MTRLALFDLDGVVLSDEHRVEHALAKRWAEYFDQDRMALDTPFPEAVALIKRYERAGWTIGYLTGRRSALRAVTERTLDIHGFPFGRVLMREPVWHDADGLLTDTPVWPEAILSEFKADTIADLLTRFEDVVLFEDDPEVVRVVRGRVGVYHAELVPWANKPEAMVKKATA